MVRKLLLFSLLFVALLTVYSFSGLAYSNSCQLAYPMMEVLECSKGESFSTPLSLIPSSGGYNATYSCISDCELTISARCNGWGSTIYGSVLINGVLSKSLYTESGAFHDENLDTSVNLAEGDEANVRISCDSSSFSVQVSVRDSNKYIYATNHEWPQHKLAETQNCIPQSRVKQMINQQVASGNLPQVYYSGGQDALGNQLIEPENFVDLSMYNINTEMKVGDTISYFYRWEDVPDINLAYDKLGSAVYCGGSTYDRKIYSYATINTKGGNCYNVPSSTIKKVECCSDSDCGYQNEVCGPDFTCTDQKPCNSDYQCGSIEPTCNDKQLSSWSCDLSTQDFTLPNGEKYGGWCKKNVKPVACCANSCPVNYHCDYNEGCVRDIHFMACPPGSCCSSGGDYKPKSCSEGYECCTSGGLVGECKSTCNFIPIDFNIGSGDIGNFVSAYCEGGNSIFGSIMDIASYFVPGLSSLTPMFDMVNDQCPEQQQAPEEASVESVAEGGGLSSLLLGLLPSLF